MENVVDTVVLVEAKMCHNQNNSAQCASRQLTTGLRCSCASFLTSRVRIPASFPRKLKADDVTPFSHRQ